MPLASGYRPRLPAACARQVAKETGLFGAIEALKPLHESRDGSCVNATHPRFAHVHVARDLFHAFGVEVVTADHVSFRGCQLCDRAPYFREDFGLRVRNLWACI